MHFYTAGTVTYWNMVPLIPVSPSSQVALTWTVLKTLHASGRGPDTRPVSGDMGSVAGEQEAERRLTRIRSQSGTAKRAAGKLKLEPAAGGRRVSGNTSESEEEAEEEADCRTLTQIALGQGGLAGTTGTMDFFGESELAGLGVEHLVSLEGGGTAGQQARWASARSGLQETWNCSNHRQHVAQLVTFGAVCCQFVPPWTDEVLTSEQWGG